MKSTILSLSFLAVSTSVWAQAPAAPPAAPTGDEIALLAVPAQLRATATVIKWKPDYTYDTVKKGTGRIVCFDKSGMTNQQAFSLECTSLGNLDRAAQNLKFEAQATGAARQALLDAAEKDGTRAKPEYGSVWYHLMGPSKENARTHMTIAVPGATKATTGLPEDNKTGGVWIMNPGTSTAHLMTPGE